MTSSSRVILVAVSTFVLAALAVSAPADPLACPPGRAVDLDQPVLPWQRPRASDPVATARIAKPPKVMLTTAVGDGGAVLRAIARTEFRCGSGRGDLILRVRSGSATVIAHGFDDRTAACLRSTIQGVQFSRVGDDTLVRLAIELR